jgi:predicted alpha/beta superfamily hydrolase
MKNLMIITVVCVLIIIGGIVLTIYGILHTTQVDVLEGVSSDLWDESQDVEVYMPPTYEMYLWATYPVVYIHGGPQLLGEEEEAEWSLKSILDDTVQNDIKVVVVISVEDTQGIADTLAEEVQEGLNAALASGTPGENEDGVRSGKEFDLEEHSPAQAYVHFIVDELHPELTEAYRLDDDAVHHLVLDSHEHEEQAGEDVRQFLIEKIGPK